MSNTAIVGKVHAMYAHRLKQNDWDALISCSSVAEVAAYLKSNTAYHTVLNNDMNDHDVHRGNLENLLHEKLLQEIIRLSRYDLDMGEDTAEYLMEDLEIDQILHAVIRINSHQTASMVPPNPYLNSRAHFDQHAIDAASTYDQLLDALQHTRYYKLMQPFRTADGGMENYTGLENALLADLYTQLYYIIDNEAHGKEREILHEMFDDMISLENYAWIFRLKSFYPIEKSQIHDYLLPFGNIPKNKLEQMIAADTPQQVTAVMKTTRIGKRALQRPYDAPGDLVIQVRYWESYKNMFFSSQSSVVMLSYIFLMKTELTSLVNLIEGIRYGVSKTDIKRLLNPYKFV